MVHQDPSPRGPTDGPRGDVRSFTLLEEIAMIVADRAGNITPRWGRNEQTMKLIEISMDEEECFCDGCAGAGDKTIATSSTETWDEGDGWVAEWYCDECAEALRDECDRCGADDLPKGYGVCRQCIEDFNAGLNY